MPIYRISAETIDGLVIHENPRTAIETVRHSQRLLPVVRRLLTEFGIAPLRMPTGRTEITPRSFSPEHSSRHFVDVHPDNNSATYWMIPRGNQRLVEFSGQSGITTEMPLPGAMPIEIPAQEPLLPITGFDTDGHIRLHEVVFYAPGVNQSEPV